MPFKWPYNSRNPQDRDPIILLYIFEKETEINADGKCFIKNASEILNESESRLVLNKYPYQVPENTEHYILWYPICSRTEKMTDEKISLPQQAIERLQGLRKQGKAEGVFTSDL